MMPTAKAFTLEFGDFLIDLDDAEAEAKIKHTLKEES